jgi:ferredoxin--NADP+ reductase
MDEIILNSVVTSIIQVSPTMKIFRITPDGWDLPEFEAGQFAALALPGSAERHPEADPDREDVEPDKLIKRVYSIASSSKAKEYIEFYITMVRSGSLTPRLFNLKMGDRIDLGKKAVGMFTLDQVPTGNNVVLIATGTGIAPYISMIRSNAMLAGKNHIAVIHGAANSWDLGYSSELNLIESISDKFNYLPTILEPQKEHAKWNGDTRFIQDMWTGNVIEKAWGFKPTPDNTHVFLCGNPKMTSSMQEALEKEGFIEHSKRTPGQIHVEKW